MKVRIDSKVFTKFNPNLAVGFILIENFDDVTRLKQAAHLLLEAERYTMLSFNKETVKNHYLISPWNVAQQEFGPKAKHYHTSIEKLMKRVLDKKRARSTSALVNIVRYIALRNIVPYGIDDASKIHKSIAFKVATGREKVEGMRRIKKNALYYRDEERVLGMKLDYWKSKKTQLTKNTNSALIHFFALPPFRKDMLTHVMDETASLLKTFCGGKVTKVILDKKKKVATFKR